MNSLRNTNRTVLFDHICCLPHEKLARIITKCSGAFYLVRPSTVADNVRRLTTALHTNYKRSSVAYSYKTNYNGVLIVAAMQSGALSEVVSSEEYAYALSIGAEQKNIIFNGVGRSDAQLRAALSEPLTLILDSIDELKVCAKFGETQTINARIGLRVAPALPFIPLRSRFGIDFHDLAQVVTVKKILASSVLTISGFHMHHSAARSAQSFVERLEYLCSVQRDVGIENLDFIDLGGGMASGMPKELMNKLGYAVDSLEQYGDVLSKAMRKIYPACGTELIVEPGTGILADSGVYVTPVLSSKCIGGHSCAAVDGTIFTIDPLRSSIPPMIHKIAIENTVGGTKTAVNSPVEVGGNSCMETDVIHPSFDQSICTGDILVIAQKGAYAASIGAPFIQGIPALVSIDKNGKFKLLRKRTNSELLKSLNISCMAEEFDFGEIE